jgi:hypothetical protein
MKAENIIGLPPRELAIERMHQFFLNHKVEEEELNRIRGTVSLGIRLKEKYGLQILEETEAEMVEQISQGLYLASQYLHLPVPDEVGFIEGKKGIPDRNIDGGNYSLADNAVSEECPNGIICYSPFYLKQIADCIERVDGNPGYYEAMYSLMLVSSHEIYHTREHAKFPRMLRRDVDILENSGIEQWNNTHAERGAKLFGDLFATAFFQKQASKLQI